MGDSNSRHLAPKCSQSKRATNCANPGFLVIQFCTRCGQTCGQAFFLTTSACGGNACIAGVSRDCGHGMFRLEGGATRSQTKCLTDRLHPVVWSLPRDRREGRGNSPAPLIVLDQARMSSGFLLTAHLYACQRYGEDQAFFLTTSACGGNACIAGVSRDCGHGMFRLEGGATRSQSKRATNCANPGFLVIEFCSRCGQTCGQAVFLTTSTCGGSACIEGISRDCGNGIFRLEGGATRSQKQAR